MKSKVLGWLAVAVLGGPTAAMAVDLHVDGNGVLIGASGVHVGGSTYDVEFVAGSCIDLFSGCDDASDFTFQDAGSAQAASIALLNSVFTGVYTSEPGRTAGCTTSTFCLVLTPYSLDTQLEPGFVRVNLWEAFNVADAGGDVDAPGVVYSTDDLTQYDALTYARWTPAPAPVPEPGTLALLGLGLAGLGWGRRKRT